MKEHHHGNANEPCSQSKARSSQRPGNQCHQCSDFRRQAMIVAMLKPAPISCRQQACDPKCHCAGENRTKLREADPDACAEQRQQRESAQARDTLATLFGALAEAPLNADTQADREGYAQSRIKVILDHGSGSVAPLTPLRTPRLGRSSYNARLRMPVFSCPCDAPVTKSTPLTCVNARWTQTIDDPMDRANIRSIIVEGSW